MIFDQGLHLASDFSIIGSGVGGLFATTGIAIGTYPNQLFTSRNPAMVVRCTEAVAQGGSATATGFLLMPVVALDAGLSVSTRVIGPSLPLHLGAPGAPLLNSPTPAVGDLFYLPLMPEYVKSPIGIGGYGSTLYFGVYAFNIAMLTDVTNNVYTAGKFDLDFVLDPPIGTFIPKAASY